MANSLIGGVFPSLGFGSYDLSNLLRPETYLSAGTCCTASHLSNSAVQTQKCMAVDWRTLIIRSTDLDPPCRGVYRHHHTSEPHMRMFHPSAGRRLSMKNFLTFCWRREFGEKIEKSWYHARWRCSVTSVLTFLRHDSASWLYFISSFCYSILYWVTEQKYTAHSVLMW